MSRPKIGAINGAVAFESPQARIAKSFLALASGDAAARLIAFGASILIARRLGAEMFGTIVFASAVLLYFQNLAQCGIDLFGVRFVAEDEARAKEIVPALLGLRTLVGAALTVLLGLGALVLLDAPEGPVLALYALTLLTIGPNTKWVFLGLQRARPVAIFRALGELCLVLGVLLFVHDPADIASVPLAQLVGDAVATLGLLIWLWRSGPPAWPRLRSLRAQWPKLRPVFVRAAPLVGNVLLGLLIYNSDLLFLRFFEGRESVGYYGAGYQLISFLNNLAMAYSISLLPALTRVALDLPKRNAMAQDAMAQVLALAVPIAVGGALLAGDIIALVFGEDFSASAPVLALLVCSVPFILIKEVHLISLLVREREGTVMRMTAIAVGVNLVLNLALIPSFGMLGAALATVITEAARAAIAGFYARREGYVAAPISRHWRTGVAAAAMGVALMLLPPSGVLGGLAMGVFVYAAVLSLLGGIALQGGVPVLRV